MNNKLIAICGDNKVGKDTVGSIIQYLTSNKGKSHPLDFEKHRHKITSDGYGIIGLWKYNSPYEIKKFADLPNKLYRELTGIEFKSLSGDRKELERPRFIEFCENIKGIFGQELYVKRLFEDYYEDEDYWIVTDLRKPYEEQRIRKHKGLVISVLSNEDQKSIINCPDAIIVNDCCMTELVNRVREKLIKFGVL